MKEKVSQKKLAQVIKNFRKKRNFNQEEIGKYLGVSQSCISKMEQGKLEPTVTQWFTFCKVLDVSCDLSVYL
jgi:DNA-binding XRE family transcriptional regulator